MILISTKGNFSSLQLSNIKGDLLPLGSAIIWALFWIFNIKDKRDIVPKMFLNFAFGFVFILIISLFRNFENLFYVQNFNGIFGTIYVGIFEMGITFVIWLKALKLSKTTARVSNFIYFTPFLSLLIVSILIDETILFSTIIGLIFIVIGIIIQQYNNSKEINGK
ncbi:DMT family transporter [candidate division KSB1 bacterium]|nr:DMT family transporter [candidate division KSB1 bacterium]